MQKSSPHLKICWLLEGSSSSQGIFGPKGVFPKGAPLQKHLSWEEDAAHTPCDLERPLVSSLPREGVGREGLKPQRRGFWAQSHASCWKQTSCVPLRPIARVLLLMTLHEQGPRLSDSTEPHPVPQFPSCSLAMVAWPELGAGALPQIW